jgi:hypothetical protein
LNQPENENYYGEHEEKMDKAAQHVASDYSEKPKYEKHGENGPQHELSSSLLLLVCRLKVPAGIGQRRFLL